MACETKTYSNILDLPQVTNIGSGDFLIIEQPEGTNIIDYSDVLWTLDNMTFSLTISGHEDRITVLESQVQSLCAAISGLRTDVRALCAEVGITHPGIANIRLSLDGNTPIESGDRTNISNVWMHPYNGNKLSLFDLSRQRWMLREVKNIYRKSLEGLAANTNYDIFAFYLSASDTIDLEFVNWSDSKAGAPPPNLPQKDGVKIKSNTEPNKRLIGCLRTTDAGRTEVTFGRTPKIGGSDPKILLWNAYNQEAASFSIIDSGGTGVTGGIRYWLSTAAGKTGETNGPFEKFGGPTAFGNRVSFITREQNNIGITSIHYVGYVACWYYAYALNQDTPTVAQLRQNLPGTPISETCTNGGSTNTFNSLIPPGYNYLQAVSMTYGTAQQYLIWSGDGDRHSYGSTGTIEQY